MRGFLFACILAGGLASAAVSAGTWDLRSGYVQAQPQKGGGQQQQQPGAERGDRGRDNRGGDRRDKMTEDERRGLQRDLEKANRELYGRRPQK